VSVEVALFSLRVVAAIGLLAFLLAVFLLLWRGLRQAGSALKSYGYLIAVGDGEAAGSAGRLKFELIPNTTLGRSASNTIVVDDEFASAEHARVVLRDGRWWLEDCGSRNGTALNDEPVASPTPLADGDRIGIGRSRFQLRIDSQ
jgi:hypothetical protein